jgi:hypothetical protein
MPPRDTKLSGSAGEHYVCSMLARAGWAASLTRDGLARTDILAVQATGERRMIEVQVKTIREGTWPLGRKGTEGALSDREWYAFVRLGPVPDRPRTWVVPRDHVAAATWIAHMGWLTDPTAKPEARNAGVESARLGLNDFARYEDRWDLLNSSAFDAPVMLDEWMLDAIDDPVVGLPEGHRWRDGTPDFMPMTTPGR